MKKILYIFLFMSLSIPAYGESLSELFPIAMPNTNITIVEAPTTVEVQSSSGTNDTISAANATNAGVMTKAMYDAHVLNNDKVTEQDTGTNTGDNPGYDSVDDIPHATPSTGDSTHFSNAGEIFAYIAAFGYSTFDGAYSSLTGKPTIPSGNQIIDWTTDQGATNIDAGNYSASGGSTDEQVQDKAGAMWTGNTETRVEVTYQDGDGTMDIVVDDMNDPAETLSSIKTLVTDDFHNLGGTDLVDDADASATNEIQVATDFDIKDLTDSTRLRATWSEKQDGLVADTDYVTPATADTDYLVKAGVTGGQTVVGGTGVTDKLELQGTSGNGTAASPAVEINVGNDGATNAITILNNGDVQINSSAGTEALNILGAIYDEGLEVEVASKNKTQVYLKDSTGNYLIHQPYYWNGSGWFGTFNYGVGHLALLNNTGANSNGFGHYALRDNTGGYSNGFGSSALQNNTGAYSNGFGGSSLRYNTGAYSNGFGYRALYNNTGVYSSGFGHQSLYNNTGSNSSGFGTSALRNNTGSNSSGFGIYALYDNTGVYSSGFGHSALRYNQNDNNTAIGSNAWSTFLTNAGGAENFDYTDIDAGTDRITITTHGFGANDAYINLTYAEGTSAITGLTDGTIYQVKIIDVDTIEFYEDSRGTNISAVGTGTGHTLTPQYNYENSICIGVDTVPTASNQVVIGGSATTQTLLRGKVTLDGSAPTASLTLPAGTATASTAPLKLTSGTLLTIPEVGAFELAGDYLYNTVTTGTERTHLQYSGTTAFSFTDDANLPITIISPLVLLTGDDDTDNDTLDLQDGSIADQKVVIMAAAAIDADDTVTIAYTDTTATNAPAVVFDKVGENVTLYWSGATWIVTALQDAL